MSKFSKISLRSNGKYGTRKKNKNRRNSKPYNFCCDIKDQDDETRYDQRKRPFSSSLMVLSRIQESPMLKFQFQSIEPTLYPKCKGSKSISDPKDWNIYMNPCVKTHGPLLWYQEDEIETAKNQYWSKKQEIYNKEADENALSGKRKVKKMLTLVTNTAGPRWYQDLSIHQMKQVLALGETITADYAEAITDRTQNALAVIGVTSTFFKIAPQFIKKLQRSTRLDPIQFLREIYKKLTGQYIEEVEYKKTYNCNERIILSAIAFLALPATVIELNNRLPPILKSVFPPKPKPLKTPRIRGNYRASPYKEQFFLPPDWVTRRKHLEAWREKCKFVPRPQIILPWMKGNKLNHDGNFVKDAEVIQKRGITDEESKRIIKEREQLKTSNDKNERDIQDIKTSVNFCSSPTLPGGEKRTFDFTISGLGEKSGSVNYKICGTLNPPFAKRKSWLGKKEAHFVISGISEYKDPPQCPVTYVMTGISCVTPDNSDEQFFTELKLGNGPKRVFPVGRKNLSKSWQEWLQNADEEFLKVEKEANRLIKSVEATMRLVIPRDHCDACCPCRQTRKANLKSHALKTPYMVIDSIAENDNQNRYIVGSLAMHSPAPSPAESMINLLEVVASKEMVEKKLVINGVTNDNGETTYYISGITENTRHMPKTTIFQEHPSKPLRNVPVCACTIERMFNEDKNPKESEHHIPHTKKREICFGYKYRPEGPPAFTCKEYPNDKFCRRNPINNKLKGQVYSKIDMMRHDDSDGPPKETKDNDRMAVRGGPWGAKNISSLQVIAAKGVEAKQIPKARICEDTLSRAICKRPRGASNTILTVPTLLLTDEKEEKEKSRVENEDDRNENKKLSSPRELEKLAKEVETQERKLRKKSLKRDNFCSQRFEDAPLCCDFDNPWNKIRTAPTVNPSKNDYEKSLKLTAAVLPSDGHKIRKNVYKGTEVTSEQNKKGNNLSSVIENCNLNVNGYKRKNNEYTENPKGVNDDVKVIHSSKSAAKNQTRLPSSDIAISEQELSAKSKELTQKYGKRSSATSNNKFENRNQDSNSQRTSKSKNTEVESDKLIKPDPRRKHIIKLDHSYKKSNNEKSKLFIKNDCGNKNNRELPRKNGQLKSSQTHKPLKSANVRKPEKSKIHIAQQSSAIPLVELASQRMDTDLKMYKVESAEVPDKPRLPCQRNNTDCDEQHDNCGCLDHERASGESLISKEGPFGWKTKSQQELPREKTLVYLVEPTDQIEMVEIRQGGRPCNCRENRNKKKILLYNIGGAVTARKNGKRTQRFQIIEGVIYITPLQSPRNSEEYIPEYDIFESPYKMCTREKSDKDLKYVDNLSTSHSLPSRNKTNFESCPCGYEPEESMSKNSSLKKTKRFEDASLEKTSSSKGNERSLALKDESLTDYLASCQDTIPCWLRCAKFSKAGCCSKPKLLQIKRPVCECRYERRVVRREEEKKKWIDRQRRLKAAKKQPYMQVTGISRPMEQDTKLMISSVKKVLRDEGFIPETQYCVTGIAENYAMAPPKHIVPGIAIQSPVVTPESSKSDLPCMCGHRHWSPMDITASLGTERLSANVTREYPCRGTEQQKVRQMAKNMSANTADSLTVDSSELHVGSRSYANHGTCNPILDENGESHGRKRHKIISDGENVASNSKRNSTNFKFNAGKLLEDASGKTKNYTTEARAAMKVYEPAIKASAVRNKKLENSNMFKSEHSISNNSTPNVSTSENDLDLFGLTKRELKKMASQDFILAKLPECWLMPQLRSWIEYREGKVLTAFMHEKLCDITRKRWAAMQQTKKPTVPLPLLNLTPAKTAEMTFDRAAEMKIKVSILKEKYLSEIRKMRVWEARSYWPTMEFGRFPNLNFKEAYFTYMAGKEADGDMFRPWKIGDSKER